MEAKLSITDRIAAWWALRRLRRNPTYRAALDEVRRLMSDENFNEWMTQRMKERFSRSVLIGLGATSTVADPILGARELLTDALLTCAHYGVLLIPKAPETEDTGFRGALGITGELRSHLRAALTKSDTFKRRT